MPRLKTRRLNGFSPYRIPLENLGDIKLRLKYTVIHNIIQALLRLTGWLMNSLEDFRAGGQLNLQEDYDVGEGVVIFSFDTEHHYF